jgi:hypothetical protein
MMKSPHLLRHALAALSLLPALWSGTAHAEGHIGAAATPLYAQECGACHLAFPAGMLPASSWQRLMSNLPRHFGVDASLEADTQAKLVGWLTTNAGTMRRIAENPPEDRISRSPWFVRQHREVSADTWKRASIRSASNCVACHRGAERGDFDEDAVRIPK